MNDTLIFEADGRLFGFETNSVHKILETERIYFIPGQSAPVTGIVTLSGVPVTVLDTFALLSVTPDAARPEVSEEKKEETAARPETEFHRIVVLSDAERLLGFDIGSSEISFVWDEESRKSLESVEPESSDSSSSPSSPSSQSSIEEHRFLSTEGDVKEKIEVRGRSIETIDWLPYFDIAAQILSTESANG